MFSSVLRSCSRLSTTCRLDQRATLFALKRTSPLPHSLRSFATSTGTTKVVDDVPVVASTPTPAPKTQQHQQTKAESAISTSKKRKKFLPRDLSQEEIKDSQNARVPHQTWSSGPFRCVSYGTVGSYDLSKLINYFREKKMNPALYEDVIHITIEPNQHDHHHLHHHHAHSGSDVHTHDFVSVDKEMFVFGDGAIVCWGMTEAEEKDWKEKLSSFENQTSIHIDLPLIPHNRHNEVATVCEEIDFFRGKYTGINLDRIILNDHEDSRTRTKKQLAFSYGIVRSLKLEIVEILMDSILDRVQTIPQKLRSGVLPTHLEWREIVADLLKIRSHVNLHSQLLETPEMYWEEPQLEQLFSRMENNLDVPHRIALLNKRLDYTQEVTDIVRNYMTERSSHNMEVAIVALITLEVAFALLDKSEWWRSWTWEMLFS